MTARDSILATLASLKLTFHSTFVPWSESRSYKPNSKILDRSLNWTVTLKHDGRPVLTFDYTAGIAHAPSYQPGRDGVTLHTAEALIHETEHGRAARMLPSSGPTARGALILPDPADLAYSLATDSEVIDHGSFESWADSYGFDSDSRKAERIYNTCLAQALKLRAAIGEAGLSKLREACQDY